MTQRRRHIAFLGIALAMLPATGALAAQRVDATQPASSEPIEELVVTGKNIYEMRRDIQRAEKRFFNAYNELNKNTQFDVNCRKEAPTGTRLISQQCHAVYFDRALEDESRALMEGHAAPPAVLVQQMRLPEFRKNLLKVVSENPDLAQLLVERVELQKRYERELRSRQTGRK